MTIPENVKVYYRKMHLEMVRDYHMFDANEISLFDFFVSELEKLTSDILATEKEFIKEQCDSGLNDVNDSGIIAYEYCLKRVRYSHIVYMVSFLESFLNEGCQRIELALGENTLPVKLQQIKGNQWETKLIFLQAYGGVIVPKEILDPILKLIDLRNIIVHENGSTALLKKEKRNMLLKLDGVSIYNEELIVGKIYVKDAKDALVVFIKYINDEIMKKIDQIAAKCQM